MSDLLKALREPSPEMIKAGADQMPPPYFGKPHASLIEEYERSKRAVPRVWQAMIDALLKELG